MKATVNGVTVEGTPEEIAAFVKLQAVSVGGPPDAEIERQIRESLALIPNVNISPVAHLCTGGRRYC